MQALATTNTHARRAGGSKTKRANEFDKIIAGRIKTRRLAIGMSQTTLGEALGVTFQQIQKVEQGKNRISCGQLVRAARKLQVPISVFYNGIEGMADGSAKEIPGAEFLQSALGLRLARGLESLNRDVAVKVADLVDEFVNLHTDGGKRK